MLFVECQEWYTVCEKAAAATIKNYPLSTWSCLVLFLVFIDLSVDPPPLISVAGCP